MRTFWQKNFGWITIALAGTYAVIRLLREHPIGHALTFSSAAQAIWSGQTPYNHTWAGNRYFYSPACSLLLYGPLSLLPHETGVLIYSFLGLAFFLFSLERFGRHFLNSSQLQWVMVLICPQLYSALFAFKTEIWIMAGLFLSLHWILQKKYFWASALVMASITEFKLQTLPVFGLLMTAALLKGHWRWWLSGLSGITAMILIPNLAADWDDNWTFHQQWLSSLQEFSAQSYYAFDNIFSFLENTLNIENTFSEAQIITVLCGLLFALFSFLYLFKKKADFHSKEWILWVLMVGTIFTINFSPLQQVNAYILFAPAWIAALYLGGGLMPAVMFITASFLFFGYSDLVPGDTREIIRHGTWRPVFCDLLAVFILFRLWNIDKSRA